MNPVVNISTLSELHALTGLSEPAHPLIGMYMLRELPQVSMDHAMDMAMKLSLYTVMYKEGVEGSIGYGRSQYDYENGTLIFTAPGQELRFEGKRHAKDSDSWMLLFHPDLLAGTDVGRRMDEYTYFGYDVTEALHLSTAEQAQALDIGKRIEAEYSQKLDAHSHKLILNNLELLLNQCMRFYDRQFFQRTAMHSGTLERFNTALGAYLTSGRALLEGLPRVDWIAQELCMSPNYLSDLLRKETGLSAQGHIHQTLVDKAKHALASSQESIGEIAFGLGFEQPQSFTRLFKKHTGVTPKTYRSNIH